MRTCSPLRHLIIAAILLTPITAAAGERRELIVYKSERKMELRIKGETVRTFRIALGGAPNGDKSRQGDMKTPEGELYIAWKNAGSSFHRFLGLSYPMPRHGERGKERGLVDDADLARIVKAAAGRRMPPQQTKLGGFVGIHGGGIGYDWTLGCIAVTDEEIEFLFDKMRAGDRVVVNP